MNPLYLDVPAVARTLGRSDSVDVERLSTLGRNLNASGTIDRDRVLTVKWTRWDDCGMLSGPVVAPIGSRRESTTTRTNCASIRDMDHARRTVRWRLDVVAGPLPAARVL